VKAPPSLCFLLGLPRSGTTLLAHLLQLHPDVLAPPEPWLMLALEAFGKVDRDHPADASLLGMATDDFLKAIGRREFYRIVADTAYGQYLSTSRKRCFIDKTPRYWMSLDFIDQLYPDVPQILLLRNPYAVAASLKSTWGVSLLWDHCPPGHAAHFADRTLGNPALAARLTRPRTYVIRYEDLVASPLAQVQELISSLGYDPDKLTEIASDDFDYRRHSRFGDSNILGRPNPDVGSVDLWKSILSTKEMQAITDMISPKMIKKLGYYKELEYAKSLGVVENEEAIHWYKEVLEAWLQARQGKLLVKEPPSRRNKRSRLFDGFVKPAKKPTIFDELKRLG
jgi:hypothetical protein